MPTPRKSPEALRRLLERPHARPGRAVPGRVLLPRHRTRARMVDGVWWPRSRDLKAELPSVLPALGVRLQTLTLIQFCTADWTTRAAVLNRPESVPIELALMNTEGLISFSGPDVTVVYGLIAPDANLHQAEQLVARLLDVP
ncbi:DUF5994 family protein [Tsukamurella strandjordii]|uniref:DUF5994 family protein n=1 Tax=Tsukamurella strandjordii TaxID=147577 RepID=A0AA90NDD0_9ACTN|nr:DUF5994 family protein [Tsukamurella strandjordii]MDP0399790.1 DUF5994 family protein [Tsukamurella strandjordii]